MVGAPGSPAQSVRALHMTRSQVFVGEATLDGVATSGFFGSDPTDASYGATQFDTAGAIGHNGYFTPGSESLRNIALVAVDQGEKVTLAGERPAAGR
jgi:hypothetical protein